ncbi:MAG: hypothetical protein HYT87_10295 [Nitrospirae bacterium]|nr:hypothetical protein [Nitrospirota bacterium]
MGIFETRLEETFQRAVGALERKHFRFFLIGAVALGHRLVPQATQDVDIIVDPMPFGPEAVLGSMLGAGFDLDTSKHSKEGLRRFFAQGRFIRFYRDVHWVDLSVVTTGQDRRALDNATPLKVFGRRVAVATVEDLLVYKLLRDEPKDIEDRHLIMSRRLPELDLRYVEEAVVGTYDPRARRLWAKLKAEYRRKRRRRAARE